MLLSFFLALATFLLLGAFTAYNLGDALEKKPPALVKLMEKMAAFMDDLSFWSVGYGMAAAVISMVTLRDTGMMLVNLLANAMIVVVALPYAFDRLLAKFGGKVDNPVVIDEARNFANGVLRNKKAIGYVSVIICVMLFTVRA